MKERLWWFKASRKNLVVERENLLLEGENLKVEGENLVLKGENLVLEGENLVLEGEELQRHWQLVGFGSPATVTVASGVRWVDLVLRT